MLHPLGFSQSGRLPLLTQPSLASYASLLLVLLLYQENVLRLVIATNLPFQIAFSSMKKIHLSFVWFSKSLRSHEIGLHPTLLFGMFGILILILDKYIQPLLSFFLGKNVLRENCKLQGVFLTQKMHF